MKTTNARRKIKLISAFVLFFEKALYLFCIAAIVTACDHLDSDMQKPSVNIPDNAVYMRATGGSIIDLGARIQSNQPITLTVTRGTRYGDLKNLGKGLLQYQPHPGTIRDSFGFTIYDHNKAVLKQDSVVIILPQDSTQLPCNIYPIDDYVAVRDSAWQNELLIDVLSNDIICGYDSSDLQVFLYTTDSVSSYLRHGSAVVVGNKIKYTPNNTFTGTDEIIYVVQPRNNPALKAYGTVHIWARNNEVCTIDLHDYYYILKGDSAKTHGVLIPALNINTNCGGGAVSLTITNVPRGDSWIGPTGIYYKPLGLEPGIVRTDTIRYEVCRDNACHNASVFVTIE